MKSLNFLCLCIIFSFFSCSQSDNNEIKDRLLDGKYVCAEFHKTEGVDLGTLNTGKQYQLKWREEQMHTEGPQGMSGRNYGKWYPLSKTRLEDYKISVWGFKATYDDNGIIYKAGTKTAIGKIYVCEHW